MRSMIVALVGGAALAVAGSLPAANSPIDFLAPPSACPGSRPAFEGVRQSGAPRLPRATGPAGGGPRPTQRAPHTLARSGGESGHDSRAATTSRMRRAAAAHRIDCRAPDIGSPSGPKTSTGVSAASDTPREAMRPGCCRRHTASICSSARPAISALALSPQRRSPESTGPPSGCFWSVAGASGGVSESEECAGRQEESESRR